ncbi:SDR family NAD(P)-dependent oxidoreductase [Bdellovibrio sp.]|uniref:SDR family NAD(P)-dependent oxidoreductase n=1 Tax=Bdellovibrio sp. TaxID=28201 RepID=UPI0039E66252
MKTVLVTGGAGFIGSELVKHLHNKGCRVLVLDSLTEQVHGLDPKSTSATFAKIQEFCEFFQGDVRDRNMVRKLVAQSDVVVHLAAETGTGQSMYAISNYCDVNIQGTAILLEEIFSCPRKIEKIVVASSRAIYGEGKYSCVSHGDFFPEMRLDHDMAKGVFDPLCPKCHEPGMAVPTTEDSPAKPQSIYGITKLTQEELVIKGARAAQIPAIALRFQNVYGPGQSLSNPYTGILSIFSTRARNNNSINIFEDGLESRDFVYIDDVVESLSLAVFSNLKSQEVFNVGSGKSTSVKMVVEKIVGFFNASSTISVTGAYRVGDIRHNMADLSKAKRILGFEPKVEFSEGVVKFLTWALKQESVKDDYEKSLKELKDRGLLK